MDLSRRDFMKLVGISVASLTLTRCRSIPPTCYMPLPPSPGPTDEPTSLEELRTCWLRFGELAQATIVESDQGMTDNTLGQELIAGHRLALDALESQGALTASVAALIQEAYEAAVYHVWRSNTLMTCYEPMMVDYAPVSAQVLVEQSRVLSAFAAEQVIDAETLEKARLALEHDLAFYALTEQEVAGLYDRLVTEWQQAGATLPTFDQLELEITPDAEQAARFITDLLTGK